MNRILVMLLLLLAAAVGSVSAAELKNRLKNHPSPYLAMHGKDPVAWQSWGPDVVERARREKKLIFVSIGYFSCHWCHVMQRESYQNPQIAAFLNKHFIPVKVDRELRPALDTRLIEFVQATRGHSGWPLNVFITPEGYPLVGVVYLPPANFRQLLVKLDEQWKQKRAELEQLAKDNATTAPDPVRSDGPVFSAGLVKGYIRNYIEQTLKQGDDMAGGFGGTNKFPQSPQLLMLLHAYQQQPSKKLKAFLVLTLDQMARGGLRDHLRGGFYRYVVDPSWHIPHFEKMLYDNAQLAEVYFTAARILKRNDYRQVAIETLDFMIRELQVKGQAMIASLSAVDDKGVEGGYYLWRLEDLRKVLTPVQMKIVRLYWGFDGTPELKAGFLPRIVKSLPEVAAAAGLKEKRVSRELEKIRKRLLYQQRRRVLPRDDKQLAGWNGLALRALAIGYRETGDRRYYHAGNSMARYLAHRLWNGKVLVRARSGHGKIGNATLEDYAYTADGLYSWYRASDNKKGMKTVDAIVAAGWQRFRTAHGWKIAENMLVKYGAAEPMISDSALASSSAVLLRVTLLRAGETGSDKEPALSALNTGGKILLSDPFWYATHISVMLLAKTLK